MLHACVVDGELNARVGPAPDPPDPVIAAPPTGQPPLRALMNGDLSPDSAIADGLVHLTGRTELLPTFAHIFRI